MWKLLDQTTGEAEYVWSSDHWDESRSGWIEDRSGSTYVEFKFRGGQTSASASGQSVEYDTNDGDHDFQIRQWSNVDNSKTEKFSCEFQFNNERYCS
jgi:hypothetical protein